MKPTYIISIDHAKMLHTFISSQEVACWTSDHWATGSNPVRSMLHHLFHIIIPCTCFGQIKQCATRRLSTSFHFVGLHYNRHQTNGSITTALDNVDNHYLTVGMFEDLPAYMEVLEYIMPQVFSNITEVYKEICKHANVYIYMYILILGNIQNTVAVRYNTRSCFSASLEGGWEGGREVNYSQITVRGSPEQCVRIHRSDRCFGYNRYMMLHVLQ